MGSIVPILRFDNLFIIISLFGLYLAGEVPAVNFNEKCPYKDTIDLTKMKPLDNGSYIYHNVLITDNEKSEYNYTLLFGDKKNASDSHFRGCVCGRPRKCVKLCCESGMFYNESTSECEMIPNHLNMPTTISVLFENKTEQTVNITEYFVPQIGKPCEDMEGLTMEEDSWKLTEVRYIR